jgi:L-histidine Nalpha-methyltransferase
MVMIRTEPPAGISPDELRAQFRRDVLAGLQAEPKSIPSKYLYDAKGSRLFEQICALPEYYLTRTEGAILRQHAAEIADFVSGEAIIIEPGSGVGAKGQLLLSIVPGAAAFVPIDIDQTALKTSAQILQRHSPRLTVRPLWADFTQLEHLGDLAGDHANRVLFFPGSTIGNFEPHEAVDLLGRFQSWMRPSGKLILGLDLEKDPAIIKPAYNDSAGLTEQFNLNLLARINRELGGTFDLDRFCHVAPYRRKAGRVEMHLISLDDQVITVDDQQLSFHAGETIHTENSYKYRLVDFCHLAAGAGWKLDRLWTDEQAWFAVLGFSSRGKERGRVL